VLAPPALADRFEFSFTAETIEVVADFYKERWPSEDEGSWVVAPGPAVEAFDSAAIFDRARLARLYGGRSPRIARGPVVGEDTDYVVLLMSPYPDADLRRLNPGTLIMEVRVAAASPEPVRRRPRPRRP
jgi:hypothetical protein